MLEKMADRLFEHPATVLVVTNLYYAEAPWLTPRSVTSAQGLIWKDVTLTGNTAHGFAEQIGELEGFLAENWRAGISPTTGNPVYQRPVDPDAAARGSLIPARPDHAAAGTGDGGLRSGHRLAALPGAGERRVQGFKGVDAAGQVAAAGRPADRHPFARQGSRHRDHRPGLAGRRSLQDRPLRHPAPGQARARRGGPALQFQRLLRRALDLPLPHAHAAGRGQRTDRDLDAVRGLERRDLRRRRSRTTGCRKWSATAATSKPPTAC